MSIYERYGTGEVKKQNFKLTKDNILFYKDETQKMDKELKNLRSYLEITKKLQLDPEERDPLFTEEYLKRRLEKISENLVIDEIYQNYIDTSEELDKVNAEIKVVFPQVMDKKLGRNPEIHDKMSELNDRRKELEDQIVNILSQKFGDLRRNLPKIFFLVLDGVDMETVNRCFSNMISVLYGDITTEEAAESLMKFSEQKYNLPTNMFDPIRKKKKKHGGRKSK
jgi:RNase P/RNase MRP subunit POP5